MNLCSHEALLRLESLGIRYQKSLQFYHQNLIANPQLKGGFLLPYFYNFKTCQIKIAWHVRLFYITGLNGYFYGGVKYSTGKIINNIIMLWGDHYM